MLRKSLVKKFVIGLFALGMLFSMGVTVVSAGSTLTGRTVKLIFNTCEQKRVERGM